MAKGDLPPRLKELLGSFGARMGLEDARATGMVWSHWAQIVGEAVAGNAEPTSLKNGILRVRATTPTWAQELTYLAAEIRDRANALTGTAAVREVRVWTGPGPVTAATPGGPASGDAGPGSVPPAGAEEPTPENLATALDRARRAGIARGRTQGPQERS